MSDAKLEEMLEKIIPLFEEQAEKTYPKGLTAEEIASKLDNGKNENARFLSLMETRGFIRRDLLNYGRPYAYILGEKGRKYLENSRKNGIQI